MKKIIIVTAIMVFLIIVSTLLWAYLSKDNSLFETSIENWKTYENKEFGYLFKYPERFSIIQPLAQGYIGGNILVDPDIAYITAYVVTTPHPPLNRPADLTIDGHSAILTPPYGDYRSGISIYKNDSLINIYLTKVDKEIDKNSDELIRKLISTIKLTN